MTGNNSNKLLTIGIPTWNRVDYLKILIEQLVSQISHFTLEDTIELLISNNNSEDSTEEVVQSFKKQFPFITYNRNSTNIGAKSNVIKAMELASSEFVMIIGDDDRIREDCLQELIQKLITNDNIGVLLDTHKSKIKYNENIKIIDETELVKNFFWYMGNAGHFIVRTDYAKVNISKYGYSFFNECWPQTQIMILGLQNSKDKCYVSDCNIQSESIHTEVMIYTSFYLWRTCYYELLLSINDIKDKISADPSMRNFY